MFVAVVLTSKSVCRCCSYIEKCLSLLLLYRKVFAAVILISESVCRCSSYIEKCLSLLILYRKVFVAVVLISKSVCRCCSYIEKEKTSGNEITYIAAHLKKQKQPPGVLLNSTQDPLKMFEKVHF